MKLQRGLRLAGSLLTLSLLAACGAQVRPVPELVADARVSLVAVEAQRGATVTAGEDAVTGASTWITAQESRVSGAGIALDDGAILTSAHLVEGAARVMVRPEGAEAPLEANVIGVSVCDDLALLEVAGARLKAARLGSSADLQPGTPVVALGFASGGDANGPLVSEGLVSWIAPTPEGLPAVSLLLTSAALAPAGSGGPLLDRSGAVVGLMTAGRFGHPAGSGDYVIGIDYARAVAEELRERGSVLRLGLALVELRNDAGAPYRRLLGPAGVAAGLFVSSVAPEAAVTGVAPGDVVTGAAGRMVGSLADLCGALGQGAFLPAELDLVRRTGERVTQVRAIFEGELKGASDAPAPPAATPPPIAAAAASRPTAVSAQPQSPAPAATTAASPPGALDPGALQAAREALAVERAQHREILFETFDSEQTKTRWRPSDDAQGARELVFSYYRLSLKQPGSVVGDAWPERTLGARYIVELEVALPVSGGTAAGIAFDQQADGSGLSTFTVGADGSWQMASFKGGALVPDSFARGVSPAFVRGGGTNFLRVVRLPAETQLWLNDTLVARAKPGPFLGGHAGVIASAGPEPLPQPAQVIVDNFRLLEHP